MIRRNRRQGMIKQKQKARLGWAGLGMGEVRPNGKGKMITWESAWLQPA